MDATQKAPYLARQLSVSRLVVLTLTSVSLRGHQTRMVMQVTHRDLYWFGLRMPYVQCDQELCIFLHSMVLAVGVTSQLRERAKSQVSVGVLGWCSLECSLLLWGMVLSTWASFFY